MLRGTPARIRTIGYGLVATCSPPTYGAMILLPLSSTSCLSHSCNDLAIVHRPAAIAQLERLTCSRTFWHVSKNYLAQTQGLHQTMKSPCQEIMILRVPASSPIRWATGTGMPTATSALAARGSPAEKESFGRRVSTGDETTLDVTEGSQSAMSRSPVNSLVAVARALVVNTTVLLEPLGMLAPTIQARIPCARQQQPTKDLVVICCMSW